MTARHALAPSPDLKVDASRGLGGLLALVDGVETAFPLAGVEVRTSIAGDVARSVIVQRFHNPHRQPLEVVHLFPLPEDGAVVELELRAGEVVVRGVCQERAEAQANFEKARQDGHRAALLTQERDDVHTLRVTRIPPGEEVRVRLVVVERLERIDGRYRWRFPTVIAPRYLSGAPVSHDGPGVLPATDRVPDGDRLQPPARLAGGTPFDLEVEIAGPVRRLQCAQHAFRIDLDREGVRIAPSGSSTLDRDFVLAFATAEADRVVCRAWTDGSHTLVVVEPPSLTLPAPLPRDAVFVVDISGSMEGVKLDAARRALTAAVHGLVDGDRFRLIAFDDRVEPMSADFMSYDAGNLRRADAWIAALHARGGTEMLPAIQESLRQDDVVGRSRSVLFITDGQAWNEAELTAAVANRRRGARFFTFGIDTAVNGALLKRLARVGGGTCELTTPSDDIEEALADLEARFGSPILEGVGVEGLSAGRLSGEAVFTGRPATLIVDGAPTELAVFATGPAGPWRTTVKPERVDFPLGALWARDRISALEDRLMLKPFEEEALRPEMIRIALAWSIASRFTAFVAIDQGRVVSGDLKEQVQPAQAPAQWATGAPMSAAMPSPPPPPSPAPSKSAPRGAVGGMVSRMKSALGFSAADAEEQAPMDMMRSGPPRAAAPAAAPAPAEPAARRSESRARTQAAPKKAAPAKDERALAESADEGSSAPVAVDPSSELARTQAADGSFGGDTARTAAALLTLILLGHTRRKGSRRRTVLKAADWLRAHGAEPHASAALALLDAAEQDLPVTPDAGWAELYAAGVEGAALRAVAAR